MAVHQIKGFLTMRMPSWEGDSRGGKVDFYTYDPRQFAGNEDIAVIREHTMEVEVADDFDPRSAYVECLDKQIEAARSAFAARVSELEERRAKFLAIDYVQETT